MSQCQIVVPLGWHVTGSADGPTHYLSHHRIQKLSPMWTSISNQQTNSQLMPLAKPPNPSRNHWLAIDGIGDVDPIEPTHWNDSTSYWHCDTVFGIKQKHIGDYRHNPMVPCGCRKGIQHLACSLSVSVCADIGHLVVLNLFRCG